MELIITAKETSPTFEKEYNVNNINKNVVISTRHVFNVKHPSCICYLNVSNNVEDFPKTYCIFIADYRAEKSKETAFELETNPTTTASLFITR